MSEQFLDRNGVTWTHDEGDDYASEESSNWPGVILDLATIRRIHGPLTPITDEEATR